MCAAGMTALRMLDLGENEMEDDGTLELASALQHLKQLQHLSLITNQVCSSFVLRVVMGDACMATLPELDMIMNNVQHSYAGPVLAVIPRRQHYLLYLN